MTAEETAGTHAEKWGQVRLDGELYPILANAVTYENLARFERKLTLGDYTRDSDDLISSIVFGDFSGGGQILDKYRPGAHQSRFWWAEGLHTRDPFGTTHARKVYSYAHGDNAYPLGDCQGIMYFSFDREIRAWDEATGAFGAVLDTLSEQPVNLGFEFEFQDSVSGATDTMLWIPHGENGYSVFDPDTAGGTITVDAVSTVLPIAFQEWDGKLFALEKYGRLSHWDESGATWDTSDGKLPRRHEPRNLIVYQDAQGSPVLWAITSKGIWAYDRTNKIFYQSNFKVPPHPSNGYGAEVWQSGGDAYYAAGMGVYRYTVGSTISAIGLDRDEGVPARYRGQIKDMRAAHNELYVLCEGEPIVATEEETMTLDEGLHYDDAAYLSTSSAYSSLNFWTGFGWHNAWVSTSAGSCTRIFVSEAEGYYRVWWGFGDSAYTIKLPVDFHNPVQGLAAGVDDFESTGFLETGWFDADMRGFTKIGAYCQAYVMRASDDEVLSFYYQRDFEEGWTEIPSNSVLNRRGRRVMSFGMEGIPFGRIRFRVVSAVDNTTDTEGVFDYRRSTHLDAFSFYYVKNPNSGTSWTFDVPMPARKYHGRSAEQVFADLDALSTKQGFVTFTHKGRDYRVRLSQTFGENGTARDGRGTRRVSIVWIPEPADAPIDT